MTGHGRSRCSHLPNPDSSYSIRAKKTPWEQAIELRYDEKKLKERLLEAKRCLIHPLRKKFEPFHFDYNKACLFSSDREFKLQWKVREFPYHPINYNNQQTNCGTVELLEWNGRKWDNVVW